MVTIDSYSETNADGSYPVNGPFGNTKVAQSFTGDGTFLTQVTFYLGTSGSPTGNVVARIYAHSGTFGTSSVPTGSALATSDNIDITTVPLLDLIPFSFSSANQILLANGTRYCVSVEFAGGDGSNRLLVRRDGSSPTHAGNASTFDPGFSTWSGFASVDLCFYVYGSLFVPGLYYA